MTSPEHLRHRSGPSGVRLRSLILLRWVAVAGQSGALAIAAFALDIEVPIGLCLAVISLLMIANLATMYLFSSTYRPSAPVVLGFLTFDLVQLAALLALTGGLSNPFALLVIAPVAVAATALTDRAALVLGLLAIVLVTGLAVVNLPLRLSDGSELRAPFLLEFGFWLAIVIGIGFIALYTRRVSSEIRLMSEALLATQSALAREQKLTDLGGVVAAAAHELGTPLATIKLASSELIDEMSGRPDLDHLRGDAQLIREQADRCRDILQSMGRAGKDDLHLRQTLFETLLREAAEPHAARGKHLEFRFLPRGQATTPHPHILRKPEIIHGLRNLIQNAVDFAGTSVWIDGRWDDHMISVQIADDGAGYPAPLLGRIGEPFLPSQAENRQEYTGMGLGLFIAKTLLERSGARLTFANGTDPFLKASERPVRAGAIVEVIWPRSAVVVETDEPLGPNTRFEA